MYEPFNNSYAPGPKKFDFDVNEISATPQRAQARGFSASYYDVQQALVALVGHPHRDRSTSRRQTEGATCTATRSGRPAWPSSTAVIQPTKPPKVFNTLNDVKQALQTHQIAALVDRHTPTAQFISSSEIKDSVMVGQFPSTGEHYGLLFSKGNPLVTLRQPGAGHAVEQRHPEAAAEEVPAGLPERPGHQALRPGGPGLRPTLDDSEYGDQ